eukprot:TRINITY_DN34359_c0_g1_i1.p1 TRINITY_DN34359_c0_g1~~TRINITY_DN34359_c0_g1_i1.p1  ORF type:complete len:864 (+),score=144.33 TRINITY_DN34359_c0_g1_i1:229-2820(+)
MPRKPRPRSACSIGSRSRPVKIDREIRDVQEIVSSKVVKAIGKSQMKWADCKPGALVSWQYRFSPLSTAPSKPQTVQPASSCRAPGHGKGIKLEKSFQSLPCLGMDVDPASEASTRASTRPSTASGSGLGTQQQATSDPPEGELVNRAGCFYEPEVSAKASQRPKSAHAGTLHNDGSNSSQKLMTLQCFRKTRPRTASAGLSLQPTSESSKLAAVSEYQVVGAADMGPGRGAPEPRTSVPSGFTFYESSTMAEPEKNNQHVDGLQAQPKKPEVRAAKMEKLALACGNQARGAVAFAMQTILYEQNIHLKHEAAKAKERYSRRLIHILDTRYSDDPETKVLHCDADEKGKNKRLSKQPCTPSGCSEIKSAVSLVQKHTNALHQQGDLFVTAPLKNSAACAHNVESNEHTAPRMSKGKSAAQATAFAEGQKSQVLTEGDQIGHKGDCKEADSQNSQCQKLESGALLANLQVESPTKPRKSFVRSGSGSKKQVRGSVFSVFQTAPKPAPEQHEVSLDAAPPIQISAASSMTRPTQDRSHKKHRPFVKKDAANENFNQHLTQLFGGTADECRKIDAEARVEVEHFELKQLGDELHLGFQEVLYCKKVFDEMDTDRSGQLNFEEFQACLLTCCKGDASEKDIKKKARESWLELSTRKTLNSPGYITFHNFMKWYPNNQFDNKEKAEREIVHLAKKYRVSLEAVVHAKHCFDAVDTDKSGEIELDEFREVLSKIMRIPAHIDLPSSRVQTLWLEIDVSGDSKVNFKEFVRWWMTRKDCLLPYERFYSSIRRVGNMMPDPPAYSPKMKHKLTRGKTSATSGHGNSNQSLDESLGTLDSVEFSKSSNLEEHKEEVVDSSDEVSDDLVSLML